MFQPVAWVLHTTGGCLQVTITHSLPSMCQVWYVCNLKDILKVVLHDARNKCYYPMPT